MNLQLFAPEYTQKKIIANFLMKQADREFYLATHTLLLKLLPKVESPERIEYKFDNVEDTLTCMGVSWDKRHLYVAGYDNHFHLLENYETEEPSHVSYELKNTPLCLLIWRDSWLLIGGKSFMLVFSLEERRVIHKWNINIDDKGAAPQ